MVGDFSQRARQEAERYGDDPWIFVRELLQNARDAGARSVTLAVEAQDGVTRLTCQDDGEGMSFVHAQRFLFTLYASSKEGKADEAGRFGVGFWSILRFQPSRIRVRSWPKDGSEPWEVTLEGGLTQATRQVPPPSNTPGTELVLERPDQGEGLASIVFDAASQTARFLTWKKDARRPLTVTVNGAGVNAPFVLPAPSVSFQRGRLRGVVGLGNAPRVELFSKGLRIRSAVTLEDLLSPPGRKAGFARLHFPPLTDGLAPQALLECEDLEVLLSRRDARDTAALRELVRLAQRELGRLLDQQIDASGAEPRWRRLSDGLLSPFALGFAGCLLLALFVGSRVSWQPRQGERAAYRDLASGYSGPRTDVMNFVPATPAIRYSPATSPLHLAALQIAALDEQGRSVLAGTEPAPPYPGSPCAAGCIELEVEVNDGPGVLRLPVPTGHRLDAESARLEGQPVEVLASWLDEPFLRLAKRTQGTVRYRTGPAKSRGALGRSQEQPPATAFGDLVPTLRGLPPEERVQRALRFVRHAVSWSDDPVAAESFSSLASRGVGFVERTLQVGAGDCDVQNGVLLRLLQDAGIPARMAIGYIGQQGQVHPWLHAWVEYDVGDGRLQVLDASEGTAPASAEAGSAVANREPEHATGSAEPVAPVPVPAAERLAAGPPVASPAAAPEVAEAAARETSPPPDPPPSFPEPHAPPPPASSPQAEEWPVHPTPRVRQARTSTPFRVRWGLLVPIGLLAAVGFAASRRVRRSTLLDPEPDLAKLLRGALENPAAFRHASSIEHRRIIPCVEGKPLSLSEARSLAARTRLYSTASNTWLVSMASRLNAAVLDRRRPEGAAVAQILGAVDLDAWRPLLARGRLPPLLAQVGDFLEEKHLNWLIFTAPAVPGGSKLLEIRSRSPWPRQPFGIAVMDDQTPWLSQAARLRPQRPRQALFSAVDRIAKMLELRQEEQARLLAPLAAEAVREAASP